MTIEIGVLIAIGGLLLSYLGYQRSKTKDANTDTRQDAETKAQLSYISKGVDDIRIDLKANERQMVAQGERLTRVEESVKQSHRRIDSLESKEDKQHG